MSKELYYSQLTNAAFNRRTTPYTYNARPKLTIDEWFNDWKKRTHKNGGVLIGGSIRELLNDFKNDQPKIN